jgi:hypothetical protein
MAYFPHAFQKLLVGTDGFSTKDGQNTLALVAGEIGVVSAQDNLIQDLTATPTYAATPLIYLAQGSFHANDKIGPFHGGYKETVKSKGINPKYVSAFYVTEPANAVNHVITVGAAAPCDIKCNTTYRLRVDVKGSPALRFLTHNAYKTVDAFTGCCAGDVDGTLVDSAIVYEAWAAAIAEDPILGKFIAPSLLYTDKSGASPVVTTTKPANWDTIALGDKWVQLKLTGAYVDTKFGNCSFDPKDHFEIEPVYIYASAVDSTGDPCSESCFFVAEVTAAYQGKGYGETLVRELILSKRYQQEPWTQDSRLREVLDDTTLSELNRGSKYFAYHILHSVPRKSNPTGMMDADQYLVKIVVDARDAAFEAYIDALLASSGNHVQLQVQL